MCPCFSFLSENLDLTVLAESKEGLVYKDEARELVDLEITGHLWTEVKLVEEACTA